MACGECGAKWRVLSRNRPPDAGAADYRFDRAPRSGDERPAPMALGLLANQPGANGKTRRPGGLDLRRAGPIGAMAVAVIAILVLVRADDQPRPEAALLIHDVAVAPPIAGHRQALTVTGTVTNHSAESTSVPDIVLTLAGDDAAAPGPAGSWTHRPAVRRLASGASMRFRTSVASALSHRPQISVSFDPAPLPAGS